MMEEEIEFEIARHHPVERRYIILKQLKRSFFESLADAIAKSK